MKALSIEKLRPWIERNLVSGENVLATSNQGVILLFRGDGQELIVKTAMGRGLLLRLRRRTLLREYRAYQRMQGLAGVPECYGLLDGRYLLLQYIAGTPYRNATFQEREQWFADLLDIVQSIHARGVSHGDLKSKGNLLVDRGGRPCLVDFGTAFVHKPGFHPLNNWLFRMGRRLDSNAWVKHKYHGIYRNASETDRALLDYGRIEMLVRKLRGRPMDRLAGRKSGSGKD